MSKIVLITGCSTGIGLKLAVRLATTKLKEHSYKVYATMRNLDKQNLLVAEAGNTLNKTLLIRRLDVCQQQQVQSVMQEILKNEGRIDVLVNNAGFGLVCAFEKTPMEVGQQMMETNFFGAVRCMQTCIPVMKRQGSGHIVNLSSISGIYGSPFNGLYSATKFALEGLSESLSPELRDFGVFISLIEPGPVDTPFVNTWVDLRKDLNEQVDRKTQKMTQDVVDIIVNRPLSARESTEGVVDVIVKCMSDKPPSLRYPTSEKVTAASKRKLVDPSGDTVDEVMKDYYPIFNK